MVDFHFQLCLFKAIWTFMYWSLLQMVYCYQDIFLDFWVKNIYFGLVLLSFNGANSVRITDFHFSSCCTPFVISFNFIWRSIVCQKAPVSDLITDLFFCTVMGKRPIPSLVVISFTVPTSEKLFHFFKAFRTMADYGQIFF